MSQLIKITASGDRQTVLGRDLHKFLEIETPYAKWFNRMCEYGFAEILDFAVMDKNVHDDTMFGGIRKIIDHQITLGMAKEISMIQRTEKGKQARLYFIECEKQLRQQKQLPQNYKEALQALITSEEEKERIERERDEAVRAKAYISDTKTATALGKVGGLTKENNRLRAKLDICANFMTVIEAQSMTSKVIDWRRLRDYCLSYGLEIRKVPDERYGQVNAYPAQALKAIYGISKCH